MNFSFLIIMFGWFFGLECMDAKKFQYGSEIPQPFRGKLSELPAAKKRQDALSPRNAAAFWPAGGAMRFYNNNDEHGKAGEVELEKKMTKVKRCCLLWSVLGISCMTSVFFCSRNKRCNPWLYK